jgi:hypothetical protein
MGRLFLLDASELVGGLGRGLERVACTVRVRYAELIACLAGEVDDLIVLHPARLARGQHDVAERDLL